MESIESSGWATEEGEEEGDRCMRLFVEQALHKNTTVGWRGRCAVLLYCGFGGTFSCEKESQALDSCGLELNHAKTDDGCSLGAFQAFAESLPNNTYAHTTYEHGRLYCNLDGTPFGGALYLISASLDFGDAVQDHTRKRHTNHSRERN